MSKAPKCDKGRAELKPVLGAWYKNERSVFITARVPSILVNQLGFKENVKYNKSESIYRMHTAVSVL
jgi:hypothetical protein